MTIAVNRTLVKAVLDLFLSILAVVIKPCTAPDMAIPSLTSLIRNNNKNRASRRSLLHQLYSTRKITFYFCSTISFVVDEFDFFLIFETER